MKKFMRFLIPVKSLAAMVFTGLMCAYMAAGGAYALATGKAFEFTIPFIFALEGLGLAAVTAVLWTWLMSDTVFAKTRYFPRLVIFAVSMLIALSVCFLLFFQWNTHWAKLWWIVIVLFAGVILLLSVIAEIYYRKTGKRYTALLGEYQKTNS